MNDEKYSLEVAPQTGNTKNLQNGYNKIKEVISKDNGTYSMECCAPK